MPKGHRISFLGAADARRGERAAELKVGLLPPQHPLHLPGTPQAAAAGLLPAALLCWAQPVLGCGP